MDSLRDLVEILEVRQKAAKNAAISNHGILPSFVKVCKRAQNILSWVMKSPLVGLTIGLVNKMDVEVYLRSTAESYFNYNFVNPELLRVSMVCLAL
ncbi:hypothetical protein HZH68_016158 [Vespula germanica]|uniref:Uncharacterized protein n=1 Tax=Vespula germanica TaxID=30212 RepID=A0A834J3G2_VESGE|nr:hypothetical protein HZH68_016158 [Vespula germanica]